MATDDRAERDRRFTELYQEHHRAVHAYAARRSPDPDQASQVVAETFTICWRRLDEASRGGRPWLFRTASLALRNSVRSENRQTRTVARLGGRADSLDRATHGGLPDVDTLLVRTALQDLAERDREVLMLTYWDDLAARDAAAVVGCSAATYAVRLHRARSRLAKALTPDPTVADPTVANPTVATSERNAR